MGTKKTEKRGAGATTAAPKARARAAAEPLKPALPEAAAPAEGDDADPGILDALLARLQPLDGGAADAFRAQFADAECDAAGAETRAPRVYAEAIRAVAGVDGVLAQHGGAIRYGATRLRFLVECVDALGECVAAQTAAQGSSADARKDRERAEAEASEARADLLHTLDLVAGKLPAARADLDAARGTSRSPAATVASLAALADLAAAWLERKDPTLQVLVRAHNLTRADATRATRAATRLEKTQRAALQAQSPANDAPATNRAEGRVLLELGVLDDALRYARAKNRLVPELKLGATLRRALRGRPRSAKPAAPDADPTKPGGEKDGARKGGEPR